MRTTMNRNGRRSSITAMLLATGIVALSATSAQAHFILNQPSSMYQQPGGYNTAPYGSPQKAPPCGQADPGDPTTATGMVTNYVAGQTITLSVVETITHPGHYRVAIAQNMAGLPAEPTVTAGGGFACGSAPINANPTLPVLADGLFQHSASYNGATQTAQIKLPDGFTCQNCVLQVLEFMSMHGLNNPGGCYYHHCATVNITANATDDMATTPPTADMATETPPMTMPEGCSYAGSRHSGLSLLHFAPLLVLGLALRRRRRYN